MTLPPGPNQPAAAPDRGPRAPLPGQVRLLLVSLGISRLGFAVVPLMAYYLIHARGLTAGHAAVAVTAFGGGWTLAQPAGGWLADHLGRRATLTVGTLSAAAAYLALGAARTDPLLVACAALVGLTFDLYRPAAAAAIADWIPDQQQLRQAMGWMYWVQNVSMGFGCLVGGIIAVHDFRIVFWVNAAGNVALAGVVLLVLRLSPRVSGGPGERGDGTTPATRGTPRSAWRDPLLLAVSGVTLLALLVYMQTTYALPLVINAAGIGPAAYGLIAAANPLAVAVLQPLVQHRLQRRPPHLVCAAGMLGIGAGIALTGLGHSVGWYAATTLVWVCGETAFMTVVAGLPVALAPPHLRGAYAGLWGGTLGLAALLAPAGGGVLLTHGGANVLWATCGAFGVLGAAACLAIGPRLRARLAFVDESEQRAYTTTPQ